MNISDRVMMHSVHVLFDEKYSQLCKDLKRYTIKYGDEKVNDYFTSMLCREDSGKLSFQPATIAKEDRSKFVPGIESMFDADYISKSVIMPDDQEYFRQFFADLFVSRVVNDNPDESNRLSICMYIPLFEEGIWPRAKKLIDATLEMEENIDIDLFLISPDLAHVFEPESNDNSSEENLVLHVSGEQKDLSKRILKEVVSYKENHSSRLKHILLMQNYNSKGYSLNLDYDGFVRIAGEYALTALVAYNDIFNVTAQDDEKPINILGLSVLSLDKYDYVQYMLHRAYLYIMDREGVMTETVSVNKLSVIAQDKLVDKVHIFSNIYDNHVAQMINDKVPHTIIAAKIDDLVLSVVGDIAEDLQDYIYTDELSLPEKRTTLAQILGEDDELLSGQQFNRDQLEMDDCSEEVMLFLIDANNRLLSQSSPDVPISEFPQHLQLADYAAFSEKTEEPATFELKELKKLRVDIRRDTEYIRKRQSELDKLEQNIQDIKEEKKVLKEGGFVYGDTVFKVVEEIEQRPFEKTYSPLPQLNVSSVDLRGNFTSIKSQGPVGACASFAFTSVYEYILNKNGKLTESDLSERYLYYYTRKRMGKIELDEGSNMYEAGKALEENGLCTEALCPYSYKFEDHKEQPSAEANIDGESRKVAETMNVTIKEHDIKSALAEGYPVVLSLHLHESFNNVSDDGFVAIPDSSDPAVGWHAMVIVGFSDKDQVFIVRNSWGTDFGDKGYCYIPYAYILDATHNSMCCIITKICSSDIEVRGNVDKLTVHFDETNTRIHAALLRIKIDAVKRLLAKRKAEYDRLFMSYVDRIETAKVSSNRDLIEDGTKKRLEWEKSELVAKNQGLRNERIESLDAYRKATNKGHFCFSMVYVIAIVVYAFLIDFRFTDTIWPILCCETSYWVYFGLVLIALLWLCVWTPYRRIHMKRLGEMYDDMIQDIALAIRKRDVQLEELRLRFHLAGAIINEITSLKQNLLNKLHSMVSFTSNLVEWHKSEAESIIDVSESRDPFISVLDNSTLQSCFEAEADKMTNDLRLYNLFKEGYNLSDQAIIDFKYRLKDKVISILLKSLAGFTVYKYISREEDYPYLKQNQQGISELLRNMDFKSEPFVRKRQVVAKRGYNNTFIKILFLNTNLQESRDTWDKLLSSNFQDEPMLGTLDSQFKMTLVQLKGVALEELIDFS